MNERHAYRATCREGDRVRLPDGHMATVEKADFVCGGNFKRVVIRPDGGFRTRLKYFFMSWTVWVEERINKLEYVK